MTQEQRDYSDDETDQLLLHKTTRNKDTMHMHTTRAVSSFIIYMFLRIEKIKSSIKHSIHKNLYRIFSISMKTNKIALFNQLAYIPNFLETIELEIIS